MSDKFKLGQYKICVEKSLNKSHSHSSHLNNLRDELSYYSKKVLEIKNDTEREVVDFVCTFHDKDPYVTSQAGLKLLNQKKFSKAMLHLLITKLGETTKSNLHEEVMDVASKLFPNDFSIKG